MGGRKKPGSKKMPTPAVMRIRSPPPDPHRRARAAPRRCIPPLASDSESSASSPTTSPAAAAAALPGIAQARHEFFAKHTVYHYGAPPTAQRNEQRESAGGCQSVRGGVRRQPADGLAAAAGRGHLRGFLLAPSRIGGGARGAVDAPGLIGDRFLDSGHGSLAGTGMDAPAGGERIGVRPMESSDDDSTFCSRCARAQRGAASATALVTTAVAAATSARCHSTTAGRDPGAATCVVDGAPPPPGGVYATTRTIGEISW
ncbi:hypothetical protein OsJ_20284 [Oryza sativa Japonica Group]|uniref:Uncharacterized protein n=1 Tax=Oryza sativa subsp. japonica TaxID=39947 RepID=A3B8U3_ORYSJ|nr:uncharacterized protein LOC4340266 [Oryza sativa Japonica Group]EAZ35982.1 hypothetical protein OsJ_20284 [Oryza sativa Japonica Group]